MSTITKDLGVVTAYGYYKAGGGTMTESEFTQFMVDFGTASKTATEAAQAALDSENAAKESEENAAQKSTEASESASTASSKAEEASQSASEANTAKNDAVTAQTAAETAQGKAEDAQAAAAQSASEAAESARTLTIDATLTQAGQAADSKAVGDFIEPYGSAYYYRKLFKRKQLSINVGVVVKSSDSTVRLAITVLQYAKNDIIIVANTGYQFAIVTCDENNICISDSGWKTSGTIQAGTYFYIVMRKTNNTEITLDDASNIIIRESGFSMIDIAVDDIIFLLQKKVQYNYSALLLGFDGYINYDTVNGTITIPKDSIYFEYNANGTATYKVLNSSAETVLTGITYDDQHTTAIKLVLDVSTWEFSVIHYGTALTDNQKLIATIRIKRGAYTPNLSTPSPWSIDGKPYGIELPDVSMFEQHGALVKSVNHRGWYKAPENTLVAYKQSRLNGFKYVETDVSFTSDDVAVLLHDPTINRTARNADGTEISETINITDITYEEVLEYDFGIYKNSQYAGTKIPTLAEFCALCKNIGLHPYIEIKTYGMTQANVESIVNIAYENGLKGNCTFISFSDSLLEYVKAVDGSARLGFLNAYNSDVTQSDIAKAQALKTDENEVFIDARINALTSTGVELCATAGLPIEVYDGTSVNVLTMPAYVTGVTADSTVADRILYQANIT